MWKNFLVADQILGLEIVAHLVESWPSTREALNCILVIGLTASCSTGIWFLVWVFCHQDPVVGTWGILLCSLYRSKSKKARAKRRKAPEPVQIKCIGVVGGQIVRRAVA